jgi:hypothetical protein
MYMDDVRKQKEIERVKQNLNPFANFTFEKLDPNQRRHIIKTFVDEINKERVGTKYPPTTGKREAIMLNTSLKTLQELRAFWSECMDYKRRGGSFGKRFYGGFKKHDWK